jgi:hypothetical protein
MVSQEMVRGMIKEKGHHRQRLAQAIVLVRGDRMTRPLEADLGAEVEL